MSSKVLVLLFISITLSSGSSFSFRDLGSSVSSDSRIIGGKTATDGQFPYQAGLQIKIENRPSLGTCGGSLISANYVLTAAHCVLIDGIELIEVHLGAHELRNEEENHLIVIVPKENFIPHEWYDEETIQNDIALLKLPESVTFTDKIQLIQLPTQSDANRDMENNYLTASGWGRWSDDSQLIANVLQFAQIRVLNQRICEHFYREVRPSMICTYTGLGQGTCNGDSGGPLAYTDEQTHRTFIVGLTSFGSDISCVNAGWPSVFTRITSFLGWIEANSDVKILP